MMTTKQQIASMKAAQAIDRLYRDQVSDEFLRQVRKDVRAPRPCAVCGRLQPVGDCCIEAGQ